MSAVSTSARLPKLAASRSAGGVARSSGEDPAVPEHRDLQAGLRSGGHQLAGRGLHLRLEVSHPP
jgi:hypothetical protein